MIQSIFWWLILWIAGTGLASRLLRGAGFDFRSRMEELVFAAALGLGLWAYLVFVLGSLHFLHRNLFIFIGLALFTFSVINLARNLGGATSLSQPAKFPKEPFIGLMLALIGTVFLFVFAGAMAPPTGQDELCYHLTQPKLYVQKGAVYDVPYATSSLWPYLVEMLFTLGLLLAGPALAKLFHFTLYLVTGFLIYQCVKRCEGPRPAVCAAAIYLLTPAAFMQAGFAYVDHGLACFAFASFYALFLFLETRKLRWAALAGIFSGFAMSTKLIGLFTLPLAAAALCAGMVKSRERGTYVKAGVLFLAAAAVFGAAWYIRAAVLRGNPVFPFYPHLFGGRGWFDSTYSGIHGRGRNALSFLLLLWDTAIHPQWFGGEKVGVLYLISLPLALWLALSHREGLPKSSLVRYASWMAVGYTVLWFRVDQNIRFYFPALALWSVVGGAAIGRVMETWKGMLGAACKALVIVLFSMEAAYAVYHFKDEILLAVGRIEPGRYLSSRSESYEPARVMNRYLKKSDKILSTGEIKGYYFDNPFTLEGDYSRFTGYEKKFPDISSTLVFLKSEGFTHVLTSTKGGGLEPGETGWRVQRILGDGMFRERFFREELIVKSRGVRYVLYRIL